MATKSEGPNPEKKNPWEGVPKAVMKYAKSQGISDPNHPRVRKYAAKMKGRVADDEIIEGIDKARPAYEEEEEEENAGA